MDGSQYNQAEDDGNSVRTAFNRSDTCQIQFVSANNGVPTSCNTNGGQPSGGKPSGARLPLLYDVPTATLECYARQIQRKDKINGREASALKEPSANNKRYVEQHYASEDRTIHCSTKLNDNERMDFKHVQSFRDQDSCSDIKFSSTGRSETRMQDGRSETRMQDGRSETRMQDLEWQVAQLRTRLADMDNNHIRSSNIKEKESCQLKLESSKEMERIGEENVKLKAKLRKAMEDNDIAKRTFAKEQLIRDRLQAELRRLADGLESTELGEVEYVDLPSTGKLLPSDITKDDIEQLKEQLKVFQEDYSQERKEKEKIRVLNLRLTDELDEAKKTIESQQKNLLLYAQIYSNATPAQIVLSSSGPARRARSVPVTPSYVGSIPQRPRSSTTRHNHGYEGQDYRYHEPLDRHIPNLSPQFQTFSDILPRGQGGHHSTNPNIFTFERHPDNISEYIK